MKMAQLNVNSPAAPIYTHEGMTADRISPLKMLRRSVLSCLLWEQEFYENGVEIATCISTLAEQVTPQELAHLAVEARNRFHLRHVPLLLLTKLAKTGSGTPILKDTIPHVIKRADELAEFVAIFWKFNPGKDITNQMKKGLRTALLNFDEYELAKYDRDKPVKTRDVAFLAHVKGKDQANDMLIARAVNKNYFPDNTKSSHFPIREMFVTPDEKPGLQTPDTWETNLSAGADKKDTFERLLNEQKLPYFALIRNLRNMAEAGCDAALVKSAILARRGAGRILPFRYIAAARAAKQFEPELDEALIASIADLPKLMGLTVVLTDVSDSMNAKLSQKGDLKRMDAAAALSSIVPGEVRAFTFSNGLVEVPPRKGMAGVDAIIKSQHHGGTYLAKALITLNQTLKYDRLIITTDEQAHPGRLPAPNGKYNYIINVASNRNGIGYQKPWIHIDGFSEAIFRYIVETETEDPLNTFRG
jgi:60 kDa SS-A/Ro ribonucleoprotein